MKRYTCVLLVAAIVALSLPAAALAADAYHFRGKNAWADFYSYDVASCTGTSVWVSAYESRYKSGPGPGTETAWADISIYSWNDCTYEQTCAYGNVQLANGAFQVSGHLASATLNTTVELFDCSTGLPETVPVAITWTGEGEVSSAKSHNSYHYPGYRYTSRSQGQSRYAPASGSVTVDGVNLIAGAEGYGSLSSSTNGSVLVQK
jgi:hypothetical protein